MHDAPQLTSGVRRTVRRPTDQPRQESSAPAAPFPAAGLVVGAADDRSEVAADRRADDVLERLGAGTAPGSPTGAPSDCGRSPGIGRRAAGVLGGVGLAGGPVEAEDLQRIEAKRGRGDRLPNDVRRSFEVAFGRSFAAVTVHRDAEADSLNRNLSATAFTTGDDIFFSRGAYRPGDEGGDRLLAHELAHVEQGSQDAQRTIRRRVGFEFETNVPVQDDPAWYRSKRAFPKATVLKRYEGFRMETDVNEFGSTLEFVVDPPLQENARADLARIMDAMVAEVGLIQDHSGDRKAVAAQNAQPAQQRSAATKRTEEAAKRARRLGRGLTEAELADQLGPVPNPQIKTTHSFREVGITDPTAAGVRARIAPDPIVTGNPQVTAGLALDRMSDVQRQVGSGGAPHRDAASPARLRTAAEELNVGVVRSPARLAEAARAAVLAHPNFPGMTAPQPSESLMAVVTVLLSYLEQGQTVGANSPGDRPPLTYAKLIAGSMMMRTDLASMVRRLPLPERDEIRDNAAAFAVWILTLAGYPGGGGVAVFERGFLADFTKGPGSSRDRGPIATLTRTQWLVGIAGGVDRLAAATADAPDRQTLESLGGLGNTFEPVAAGNPDGVVVEFRGMRRGLRPARWRDTALDTFDYLVAMNAPPAPGPPPLPLPMALPLVPVPGPDAPGV